MPAVGLGASWDPGAAAGTPGGGEGGGEAVVGDEGGVD